MADEKLDEDFFIDVMCSKIPDKSVKIRGVGRGKLNFIQDIATLKLPKAATEKQKDTKNEAPPGRGRGGFCSFMSDRPARLPKDTKRGLIGINNTSHFPALQSVAAASSKQNPSSSPKTSAKHANPKSHHASSSTSSASLDSDSSWPLLGSSSDSSKRSTKDLHSSLASTPSKERSTSSPKTSAKRSNSKSHQASSSSSSQSASINSDSNRKSTVSSSQSNKKSTKDVHSFAQSCKKSEKAPSTQYLTKKNTPSDSPEIIIMQNLPEAILEEDLTELLQLYGTVLTCDIERDNQGNSLGCALISMETKAECEWIISCFHDQEYPGCIGFDKLSCTYLK